MDGEPIGIITLEDVLEELIGNEIEDECMLSCSNRLFKLSPRREADSYLPFAP
jgi:CBS domain containing-hemolysin-like protein